MRRLQTDGEPQWHYLPSEGDRLGWLSAYGVQGWVATPYAEDGLDRFDPYGGQLPYPPPRPGSGIRRLFGLQPDIGYRTWRTTGPHPMSVFTAELWGNRFEDRNYTRPESGSMLFVDAAFLCAILTDLGRSLILEVRISRDSPRGRRSDEERVGLGHKPGHRAICTVVGPHSGPYRSRCYCRVRCAVLNFLASLAPWDDHGLGAVGRQQERIVVFNTTALAYPLIAIGFVMTKRNPVVRERATG